MIPESPINQTTQKNSVNYNINFLNENNVSDLSDEDFYQMLQNSSELSEKQIKHLWRLITSNQVNSKVKILFYDFLSFKAPDYLTTEIIKQAKNESGELRHQLLVNLQSIYQKKLEKKDKKYLKEIINFFKELQLTHLDKNDGGIVYRGLATLAPKELQTKKANLINMDKIHVDILRINSDKKNEKAYVVDIINNLNHPDDSLVVTASYRYLTELLINSELSFFSNRSKELFKKHLASKNIINQHESILYTSAYIEFKEALYANSLEEIPALANDYLQSLDSDRQEATYNGFTDFTKRLNH
ncbi:TPA: hypothetical protein GJ770_04020 [Legionella pneumophila]|nr:hypothetical protein [Legionella pneumophila]